MGSYLWPRRVFVNMIAVPQIARQQTGIWSRFRLTADTLFHRDPQELP